MTPAQVKTLLDSGVLQAYAEGKKVQYYLQGNNGHWFDYYPDCSVQFTRERVQWRVKPEKKTGWINIYSAIPKDMGEFCTIHSSQEKATSMAGPNRIACIQITYEEGEGL